MLCQLCHRAFLRHPRIWRLRNSTNILARLVKVERALPKVPKILPEELPYSKLLTHADKLEILEIMKQLNKKAHEMLT